MRRGMMIELDKCIGCQACVTSCKERWDTGPGAARDWVMEFEHGERGKDLGITFYPGLCNHCTSHPCTEPCPTGATYVGAGGVVMVDADVCIGCGNCISACPYGARHADARQGIVEKCNFCAPYVARGEQPACVSTCLAECRHFGDLDDPQGELVKLIRARKAAPLTTAKLQIGPKVYYAPPQARAHVLAGSGVIKETHATELTTAWQRYTRPVARYGVPALALATGAGGLLANLVARKARVARKEQERGESAAEGDGAQDPAVEGDGAQAPAAEARLPAELPRHRLGMRLLHWFNVLSWLVLLATGTALMIAPSFAIFGEGFARGLSNLLGGQAPMLKLHVSWGLVWALLIVPSFIVLKRGGGEALSEIRLRMDDVRWLMRKPFVMAGLSDKPLPPQDKYNAGQKAFAASALLGTTMIIATGLVMTFHLGSPEVIRWAILLHKLSILLALVGLSLHITMAALITDERPALRSMVTGSVDAHHAQAHSSKWVEELKEEQSEELKEEQSEELKAKQSETGADDEQ